MTDEIRAVYTVGAFTTFVSVCLSIAGVVLSRRANNLKDVARHEQNFALLKGPAEEHWHVDLTLADKR